MGSAASHFFGTVAGVALVLMGIGVLTGRLSVVRAGSRWSASRWNAPRLVGMSDVALGVWLLLFGLLSQHLWAMLIGLAAMAVAMICGITWLVRASRSTSRDESRMGGREDEEFWSDR